jgi:F-type H+-transporting ATPase subunit epsilon
MYVEIVTPSKTIFQGEAVSVKLPGKGGKFETLNNHAPIISALDSGIITVTTEEGSESFEINGGIVEVLNNKIVVLA